jgi:sec-independent protein translocase protein TatA
MLSIPDMAILGAAALLFFGPEQLPRVARKAGHVMREIQNTSQSFIREMERAADMADVTPAKPDEPPPYEPTPYDASAYDPGAWEETPTAPFPAVDPPAPEPDPVGEKLAEPRPAPGFAGAVSASAVEDGGLPMDVDGLHPESLDAAQPAPQPEHTAHL